jgi:acetyl-CoA carboxylase biotin carboxyl carrier protein
MTRELTHSDVSKILEIVDGAPHLDEIEVIHHGFRLHLQRGTTALPAQLSPAIPQASPSDRASPEAALRPVSATKQALDAREIAIRAPTVGTFCRSSAPGEAPFVEPGQRVRADDTICLIKTAMLLSAVKAGVDGVVKYVFPQNGELVEFDQLLIILATTG